MCKQIQDNLLLMFNYSFPNLFFFASNFKIKYYCFYAKNVCKPNRFFFSLQLSWFSSRKRYKLQYFKSHLSLFRRLWLLNSRLPPWPFSRLLLLLLFSPAGQGFWPWPILKIPCPRYTQNFICRREMCRWQAIFIHFSRARERRAANPSWREKFAQRTKKNNNKRKKERLLLSKAWPWNSSASFSFSLVKCYYYIKFWVWAVLTSVL